MFTSQVDTYRYFHSAAFHLSRVTGAQAWLMMTLFWGLCRWQSTTPNLSFICTPYVHTCTRVLFIVLLTQSSQVRHTLTFFSPSTSSLSCHNQPGSQAAAGLRSWRCFAVHESARILQWNLYILVSNFTSEWFITQWWIETDTWRFASEGVLVCCTCMQIQSSKVGGSTRPRSVFPQCKLALERNDGFNVSIIAA